MSGADTRDTKDVDESRFKNKNVRILKLFVLFCLSLNVRNYERYINLQNELNQIKFFATQQLKTQ